MKFIKYNPVDEKGNCIIRSFSKLLNKDYNLVKEELLKIQNSLNYDDYRQIEVFETYLYNNGCTLFNYPNDKKIDDLDLQNGKYAIFCYDKKDFYHMVTIIDNVIYDKDDIAKELYTIKIYKGE